MLNWPETAVGVKEYSKILLKKFWKPSKITSVGRELNAWGQKGKHNVTSLEWNALAEFRQSILKESQHS